MQWWPVTCCLECWHALKLSPWCHMTPLTTISSWCRAGMSFQLRFLKQDQYFLSQFRLIMAMPSIVKYTSLIEVSPVAWQYWIRDWHRSKGEYIRDHQMMVRSPSCNKSMSAPMVFLMVGLEFYWQALGFKVIWFQVKRCTHENNRETSFSVMKCDIIFIPD